MIVAQISDTHVKRKGKLLHHMVNTAKALRRCIACLNAFEPRPDIVVATGDLTDGGKPKEYKRLRRLLDELEIPLYLIPGNHDDRQHLRAAFPHHGYLQNGSPYVQYVVEGFPVRLIALDSTDPSRSGGFLDQERLLWLEARLAEAPTAPTILLVHHPPFVTGIRPMDAPGFIGVERFGEIVARHANVERIACGHIHRAMQVRWNGTLACTAPSTAHQVVLDLRRNSPLGFTLEPPGFLLHVWEHNAGMVTHTVTLGNYRRSSFEG